MKPYIHYLPLEPIPARYTEQMKVWVERELVGLKEDERIGGFLTYEPAIAASEIQSGQFLDNYASLIYKQAQLQLFISAMREGKVNDGDIVLVGDVWYPGLEGIRMVANLTGLDELVIAGWHYAGVFDPHDYYSKCLSSWSRQFESMIVSGVLDWVCCGSIFHKNLLVRNIQVPAHKILPYGLVWNATDIRVTANALCKKQQVVFPHRMAAEKAPMHFIQAAKVVKASYPRWSFIFSLTREPDAEWVAANKELGSPCEFRVHKDSERRTAKQHYYDLLAESCVVYSSGYQETFGYAVHEGMALGCVPCLPNRACYAESVNFDSRFLYDPETDPWGAEKLLDLIQGKQYDLFTVTNRYSSSTRQFLNHIIP